MQKRQEVEIAMLTQVQQLKSLEGALNQLMQEQQALMQRQMMMSQGKRSAVTLLSM